MGCKFCGAQNQLGARTELPAFAPPTRVQVSEPERLIRLKMQDGRPLVPPQTIAHLFGPGGQILAWKEQEVFAAWQAARKRTATGAVDAAEELFFLTEALGNQFVAKSDWARHRAMLESALEAYTLPRHRSSTAASLCMGACRQRDLAGAEAWLRLVDSASDDLYADSMYRSARARVATMKGEYPVVLQVLGQDAREFPIHDAIDPVAAAYRANAWEHLGRLDLAVASLIFEMSKGAQHRATMETIVRLHGICPQSFPQADTQAGATAASSAAAGADGGSGIILLVVGLSFVVLGVPWIVIGVGRSVGGLVMGAASVTAGEMIGNALGGGSFLLVGGVMMAIGHGMRKAAKKAAFLMQHGVKATGVVLAVKPTGLTVNDVPQLELRIRVEVPGRVPYEATLRRLFGHGVPGSGSQVSLRVDPKDPTSIGLAL